MSGPRNGWTSEQSGIKELFNQRAGDVADGDVGLLDALRVLRRNVEKEIDFSGKRAAGFASQGHQECAASAAGFDTAKNVGAVAAGGESDQYIAGCDHRFNLAGENLFETEVIGCRGQD